MLIEKYLLTCSELLLLMASLVTRFRASEVWFVRWTETKNGFYLTPHFNLPWQTVAGLFLVVLQADVWLLWRLSNGRRFKGEPCHPCPPPTSLLTRLALFSYRSP